MRQTTYKLLSTAAAVCLIFGTTTSVFAQSDFAGSLNTVSISDAAGTNKPPTASFTYTQDGNIFTFDASGSFDSDGSIAEYKWDFGDGGISNNIQFTHSFSSDLYIPVTLTVVDNNGAVALSQIKINTSAKAPAGEIAYDDFTSYKHGTLLGTTDSWTAILSDAITTNSSTVRGNAAGFSAATHTGAQFNLDHYAICKINTTSSSGLYGCIVRASKSTAGAPKFYGLAASYKRLYLYSYNGDNVGTEYTVIASATNYEPQKGDTIKLLVTGSDSNITLSGLYDSGSTGNFINVFDSVQPNDRFNNGLPGLGFQGTASDSIIQWHAGNM
jgi:PKD repeat protein